MNWKTAPATDLEAAISEFKAVLPGWWFSVCECQVSCDASCAPTIESRHIGLVSIDDRFNSGFHADLHQPSTLADALRTIMAEAQAAIVAALDGMTEGERIRFDDGRRDWPEDKWQDHCGKLDCHECDRPPTVI